MITNVELFNALRNVTAKREGSRYRILMELYTIGKGTSQRVLVVIIPCIDTCFGCFRSRFIQGAFCIFF